MKKSILTILIICSLFLMACPSKNSLAKGFEASSKISQVGFQSTVAVGDLFTANVITYETKEKLVKSLRKVQENGERFNQVLSELKAQYGKDVPADEIRSLDVYFNQNIIAPFVEILVEAGTLSAPTAEKIYLVIAALKQIVFTVSNIFGQSLSKSVSFEAVNNREVFAVY